MSVHMASNAFLGTRRLTTSREDHLTEFFAAALQLCPDFALDYAKLALWKVAPAGGWKSNPFKRVETQVAYPDKRCRPDMRLTLSDNRVVLCEHKIDADQVLGTGDDPQNQLTRYLNLAAVDSRICGLVYVRSSWKSPDAEVLDHPLYLRPEAPKGAFRDHLLWRDFYPLLKKNSGHLFVRWLQEGFEDLGFTPPPEAIPDLEAADEDERRSNRHEFAKLWSTTRVALVDGGWNVGAGSVIQLYLKNNARSAADLVIVSPLARSQRFWIRIRPGKASMLNEMEGAVTRAVADHPASPTVERITLKQVKGVQEQVQVASSLWCVLEGAVGSAAIERRLHDFVVPVTRAIPRK
jgi:hypothetical protein